LARSTGEDDLEGGLVVGADSDDIEVLEPAAGEVLGVADRIQRILVFRTQGRRERPAKAVEKIARRERVAIGPFAAGPQVKRVREPVRRDRPALGRAGPRLQGFLVERDQPLEKRAEHVVVDCAAGEMRVE
jgi:hypothetical protein